MTKFSFAKATVFALAGMFASAAVVGCSSMKSDEPAADSNVGSVGLELQIAPGVEVAEVRFTVTGNGITPITNVIPVTALGVTVSAAINGLPAGTGYTITLSATSVDGGTNCAGSANFDVIAGQTTAVSVALQCRGPQTTGGVIVGGVFNNCPTLDSVVVFPLQAVSGTPITVLSSASDLDGGTLTYAWSASAGTFVAPGSANTTYNCDVAGNNTVTISVTDGNPACNDTRSVGVTCLPGGICGNGTIELGEQCDDGNTANGDGCSSVCLREVFCGDGVREGNEECDDGNQASGDGCSASCLLEVCGNNRVDAGETCDPPNGVTCDSQCQVIGIVCGNGIVQQGELCDDGNLIDGDGCESDCTPTPDRCLECEQASCGSFRDACNADAGTAAAGPAAGTAKATLCNAMIECARTSKCAKGSQASGEGCYCGTADVTACISGEANGQCKSQAERAAESTNGLTVGQRWVNPAYAMGHAGAFIRCTLSSCRAACGLQ